MNKPKVLYVCHNHPDVRPGGAEGYALDLYEGIRDAGELEPVFLARSGPPISVASRYHEGRPFTQVNDDPNQYFFYTDLSNWDWVYGRSPNKSALTRFYRDFLLEQQPDIVHFQHTVWIGYDIIRVTRNTLPHVPIVYSIHEYLPICHRAGQMVRTKSNELCEEESPRRCHECFPDVSQQTFFMRKRFIQSQLSLVDRFIAPSEYVRKRYVDWGVPPEKVAVQTHGSRAVQPAPVKRKGPRDNFGYFGQFTPFKGADVLLKAMAILGDDFDGRLWIHGANLDTCPPEFQDTFKELYERTEERVTVVGSYEHHELPTLMERIDWVVVPSIWWETGPLTVLEAFQHGRPVISSDIGGMSEKVTDGVNGLHFRNRDPESLAEAMHRAAGSEALWNKLRSGIPAVQGMDEQAALMTAHYRELLARGTSQDDGAERSEALAGV